MIRYPVHVISAATLKGLSKYGVSLSIRLEDTRFIRALDSQRAVGKAICGGGFLLSDRAAAERAAAERAAAERAAAERAAAIEWPLSDREKRFTTAQEG